MAPNLGCAHEGVPPRGAGDGGHLGRRAQPRRRRLGGVEPAGVRLPAAGGVRLHEGRVRRLGAGGAIGEPVDLVGHDWGAGLTYRLATAHGDRLRSWVADVGNIAHPDYEWHDFARLWQTPGEGEAFFEGQLATPVEQVAAGYEAMGVPPVHAREMAGAAEEEMAASILALYRSALPNPHADWGPWTPTSAPGLVLHVAGDPFSDEAMAREVAGQLGARLEVLGGSGHFWPYEAPEAGAELLQRFWASLDG
jgi:pimeloyl-ACP methyl ester carboxylesterase